MSFMYLWNLQKNFSDISVKDSRLSMYVGSLLVNQQPELPLEIFSAEFGGNLQERMHFMVMALTCSIVIPGTSLQMELSDRV